MSQKSRTKTDRNIQVRPIAGDTPILVTLPELVALRAFGLVGFSKGCFFAYVAVHEGISVPRFLRELRRRSSQDTSHG